MLRGFCTLTFYAHDMVSAEAWYSEVFGIAPYFRRDWNGAPAYLEWRVGDLQAEFGLVVDSFRPAGDTPETGGAVIFWAVDDVSAAVERLIGLGARPHQSPTERGPGFVTASVVDPFGNILGVMENAHYREQVDRLTHV
jgi:predicted enzyme related to lactoylglutathione lyase